MLYYKTIKFFECCEHKEVCVGVIADVYSPWECIQTDPFYSCNHILDECLRGVTLFLNKKYVFYIPGLNLNFGITVQFYPFSENNCRESYFNITKYCPTEMFARDLPCPETVPSRCTKNLRNIEGWYCICQAHLTDQSLI